MDRRASGGQGEPAELWLPPAEFDGFVLESLIGRGGMGAVYAAHERQLDRAVAIKVVLDLDLDWTTRNRFLVEARAIARITHPNIVAIYRIGEVDARPYIAYELVRGRSLDKLPHPMPWHDVLPIAIGLARGLAAAHRRGVLHRDIKPANAILADDGLVKLLDFGLAKVVGGRTTLDAIDEPAIVSSRWDPLSSSTLDLAAVVIGEHTRPLEATAAQAATLDGLPVGASLTRTGWVLGTPAYMPPELWTGADASPRSDVYALGLLVYELSAGALPHAEIPPRELKTKLPSFDAPPLRSKRADVPEPFAEIVDRCVRRLPEERYADAGEVCDALEELEALLRSLRMLPGRDPRANAPPRDDDGIALVEASFARVAPRAQELIAGFYDRLFARTPEIRHLFPADMAEQRFKLESALQLAVESLRKPDRLAALIEHIGRRHAAYGVEPAHLAHFAPPLVATLAELDGAHWSDATRDAWDRALQLLVEVMLRGLRSARSGEITPASGAGPVG
ncbi:MAG: protein kinase [Deltaproteobacteria bacterium]|nr:protein kinase [Deltaproteobacteria bacterium]